MGAKNCPFSAGPHRGTVTIHTPTAQVGGGVRLSQRSREIHFPARSWRKFACARLFGRHEVTHLEVFKATLLFGDKIDVFACRLRCRTFRPRKANRPGWHSPFLRTGGDVSCPTSRRGEPALLRRRARPSPRGDSCTRVPETASGRRRPANFPTTPCKVLQTRL